VRRGGCVGSWWGNRREGDHWGDLGVDGWVILGWISRRWDVGIWTGLGWPWIETGGGHLWDVCLISGTIPPQKFGMTGHLKQQNACSFITVFEN